MLTGAWFLQTPSSDMLGTLSFTTPLPVKSLFTGALYWENILGMMSLLSKHNQCNRGNVD